MAVVAMVLLSIYFILNCATVLYCVWSWLRAPEIDAEKQQRANMRSISRPMDK